MGTLWIALLVSVSAVGQAAEVAQNTLPLAGRYVNAANEGSSNDAPREWWHTFADPTLDSLVARALTANTELKSAAERVVAATAIERQARSQGRAELDVGAAAARERLSGYTIGFANPSTQSQFSGQLEASWEVDLFGRVRNGVRAAREEAAAASEDERAARLAVILRVVREYLTLRGLERSLEIVKSNQEAQDQTALYTGHLVTAGAVPVGDQHRAEAQAATTAAVVPMLQLQAEYATQEIATLLAMTPDEAHTILRSAAIPRRILPVTSDAGVPADLLRNRPDVRAAERRVTAAAARLGVAQADLKPRLVLSGLIGSLIDSAPGPDFSRSLAWLAQATGTAPLFDGGRRRGVVAMRASEARQATLSYESLVLGAGKEVENALAGAAKDHAKTVLLERAAVEAAAAAEQTRRAWTAGETSILDVLEADRARFAAEAALVDSDTAERLDRAALYAALGG